MLYIRYDQLPIDEADRYRGNTRAHRTLTRSAVLARKGRPHFNKALDATAQLTEFNRSNRAI